MFLGQLFYHKTTRNAVVAFGNMFKSVFIRRTDAGGNVVQRFAIPIRYATKEKWLETLNTEARQYKAIERSFPTMAFEITGFSYDSYRKLNTLFRHTNTIASSNTDILYTYSSAPWNINFTLSAAARNHDDILQIMEQIIPNFQPYFNIPINESSELGIVRDVPLVLVGTSPSAEYEIGEDPSGNRVFIYTFDFTMKVNYYSITKQTTVIRKVTTQTYINTVNVAFADSTTVPMANCNAIERVTITPDPPTSGPGDDFGYTEIYESKV